MRNILFIFFLLFTTTLSAQLAPLKYSRVKVFLHESHISEIAELGLEYDHGVLVKGKYWINDISNVEIDLLKENGLQHEVLIEIIIIMFVMPPI